MLYTRNPQQIEASGVWDSVCGRPTCYQLVLAFLYSPRIVVNTV